MGETQSYGRAEIERYLQHQMSRQEMYEFEKALMNDPFLADALEGFSGSNMDVAENHLIEIERAITANQPKAKVVPLPPKKTEWWWIASIILLVISAGVITFAVVKNNSSYNNQSIASAPIPIPEKTDTISAADRPLAEMTITPKKDVFDYKKNTSPIIHPGVSMPVYNKIEGGFASAAGVTSKTADSLIAAVPAAAIARPDSTAVKQMMYSRSFEQNVFKGKVEDDLGEPLTFADIKSNNGSVSAVSDANGNFTLKAPDSVIEVNVKSPGYAVATAKLARNKADTKITLKEDNLSLSEIVVSSLSKKNKNTTPTIHVDSSNVATPVGGWKNFQQYLNQKQDFIKGIESAQNLNEDIVLEFQINRQGQPINIKVPNEMDKTLAEKTIEIISNGPQWRVRKNDKRVKVIIGF